MKQAMGGLIILWSILLGNVGVAEENKLFQFAPLQGLMAGLYDGELTFANLAKEGNFGLGTFDRLDGEMIALDGQFFRMRSDGRVVVVASDERTPFALVTHFVPDRSLPLPANLNLTELEGWLKNNMVSLNRFYALRVDGRFSALRVRSVPAQTKPYPPLIEVVKQQQVFDWANIAGTLVGFWSPSYAAGLNAAGFHFHFISSDRTSGGHLLALMTQEGRVQWDRLDRLVVQLPAGEEFDKTAIAAKEAEVKQVERQR